MYLAKFYHFFRVLDKFAVKKITKQKSWNLSIGKCINVNKKQTRRVDGDFCSKLRNGRKELK